LHVPATLLFCTDSATPTIYTLSLHDALPISFNNSSLLHSHNFFIVAKGFRYVSEWRSCNNFVQIHCSGEHQGDMLSFDAVAWLRSEEHTSELQSRENLVCRLLLEKKKKS